MGGDHFVTAIQIYKCNRSKTECVPISKCRREHRLPSRQPSTVTDYLQWVSLTRFQAPAPEGKVILNLQWLKAPF